MHPADFRCGASNSSGRRSAHRRAIGHRTSKSSPQRHRENTHVSDLPLFFLAEYIPNRLYFMTVHGNLPRSTREFHFFSTDNEFIYNNFYSDFGPLHLGLLYKYCHLLNSKMKRPEFDNVRIVHYTSGLDPEKRSNAAYLIASYAVLFLNYKPVLAYSSLRQDGAPPFKPFQDACQGPSEYTITILDCLHALYKASKLGLVNFCDFDIAEYTRFERLSQGDLNWIVPEKLLAFCGPSEHSGAIAKPPEHYLPFFKENCVKTVVRLNRAQYRTNVFQEAGIAHYDLFIVDGGTPSLEITQKFLDIVEGTRGAVAVHCKAGLGRTGTLIGAYLVKHYKMHAREAIAWLRICRPGSVIGPQHLWLESMEESLFNAGDLFRSRMYGNEKQLPFHEFGVYSVIHKKRLYNERSNYNHYGQQYHRHYRTTNYPDDNEPNMRYHHERHPKRRARSPVYGNHNSFRSHSPSWRYAFTDDRSDVAQGDALNRIKASRHGKYMRSGH